MQKRSGWLLVRLLEQTLTTSRPTAYAAAAVAIQRIKARRPLVQPLQHRDDPVAWITERLGAFLWSKQIEVAAALYENRRVAVPSAHNVGKSFLAARLCCWWLDTHAPGDAFVVTTAPTGQQVRAVLWREIHRAHVQGKLRGRLNQTEWWLGGEMVAFGRKPADYDPAAFQGIHARAVLVILDEAGGVPESIYLAAGSLASNDDSRILAIGNPDDPSSHFEQICRPGSGWTVVPIDAFDSPNFSHEVVPDTLHDLLIGPRYVAELTSDVGEDSPIYASKVRGRFPEDMLAGVIPLSSIRACQVPEQEHTPEALLPVELGFDVGAGGDMAVIRERRGVVTGHTWRYRTTDPMELVGRAVAVINETGATLVKIDVIGIGWGVAGRLEELGRPGPDQAHTARISRVNVGAASTNTKRFPRLRDQLWWEVGRELIASRALDLSGLDDLTVNQLIAPKWAPDSAGRIKVESKDETRKRIKRSPDDADAWLLAYYAGRGLSFA